MKRSLVFVGVPVLLTPLLIAGAVVFAASQGGKVISIDDDPVLGDDNAKVTIIEFGDYQCPFCRSFWKDTLPRIKKEYIDTGKVRLVFRDFPQADHRQAVAAAIAAECADDQDRYWDYHDKLFREQDRRGSGVINFGANDLKRWATEIGLDAKAFDECVDAARHKDEVAADTKAIVDLGITGTPLFFINGRALLGAYPYERFQRVIEEELAK